MFDFDVNAVAAACEAALEQELVRIDKGFYILDDEAEAFEIEDDAGEADQLYVVCFLDTEGNKRSVVVTKYELTIALRDNHFITITEVIKSDN